jgi:thioredoxin 1
VEKLDARAFQKDRLLRDGTWVVAFVADWCPFCRSFLPTFARLDGEPGFRTAIGDVSDEVSPLWDDLRIDVVPTLVVFQDGRPIHREDGLLGRGLPAGALDRARSAGSARKG